MQDESVPPPAVPSVPTAVPAATVPASIAPSLSAAEPPLTPEEQMALFEKELKETDWGHQPC